MNITVLGTGYVGLVTGACLADSGNDVVCVDVDKIKIDMLLSGKIPIYEPGLEELVERNKEEGRLSFTTDLEHGVKHGDVIFVAVGTPMKTYGEANLSYVYEAAESIGGFMDGYKVIVDKSTVPVGTADKVRDIIKNKTIHDFDMISCPEFLKEGTAINDFMKPDRIVVGGDSKRAIDIMRELFEPFLRTFHPLIVMDIRSAEMTKYAANCFLATKISFINEIANLCEKAGADIDAVREGIGADRRIGYEFLFPGVGYGGSCFPKDVQALIHTGSELDVDTKLMKAVEEINAIQKAALVDKIIQYFRMKYSMTNLKNLTFGLWGLSFKPQTDDMREAPSLVIIDRLLSLGANVKVFDPEAMSEAKKILNSTVLFTHSMYEAVENADGLVLVTEWNEFRRPSWQKIRNIMKNHVIFDGRNIFDKKRLKIEGFDYYGIGRKTD